jgi:hypothetical protein
MADNNVLLFVMIPLILAVFYFIVNQNRENALLEAQLKAPIPPPPPLPPLPPPPVIQHVQSQPIADIIAYEPSYGYAPAYRPTFWGDRGWGGWRGRGWRRW